MQNQLLYELNETIEALIEINAQMPKSDFKSDIAILAGAIKNNVARELKCKDKDLDVLFVEVTE